MTDTLSLPETTLKLFYNTLYPDLTDENLFSSYPPVETFDYSIENLPSDPQILKSHKTFIENWRISVNLETDILVELSQAHTKNKRILKAEFEKEREVIHRTTHNALSFYVYSLIKDNLESEVIAPEVARTTERLLKDYIISLNPLSPDGTRRFPV